MSKITKETMKEKLKNLILDDDKTKLRTPEEINDIAIQIVKDIKNIVESIILNDAKKVIQDLNEYYKNYSFFTWEKSFSLNTFEDPNLFYEELQKYANSYISHLFINENRLNAIKNDFNNSFSIINFSILTDLLIKILNNVKNAYEDDIIKTDISILVEIITSKVKRITNSSSLFLCFVNELMEKYQIKIDTEKSEFIKKINKLFKEKAKEKLEINKNGIFVYIKNTALLIINKYQNDIKNEYKKLQKDDSSDYSKLYEFLNKTKFFNEFYNEIKDKPEIYQSNIMELKRKCMDKNVYYFFEYYSEKLLKRVMYNSCTKEYILNNILLPFAINEIGKSDEDMYIIYNIPDSYDFMPVSKYNNNFLGYYLEAKKELNYAKEKNYKNEINEIINNDTFIKEFFSIISSKEISKYFESKIKFEDGYQVKFVNDDNYDIFLKDHYQKFIEDMKSNFNKFKLLILVKQICYKIPFMTDSSIIIFINPIYEISCDLKDNYQKINSVLKSVLFILLVYEFAHFLNAYNSEENLQYNSPISSREKKTRGSLMYYLFNTSVIQSINYEQSLILNEVSNWNDLSILRSLFKKPKDDSFNTGGKLNVYLEEADEEIQFLERGEYCLW